ncbi:MAG: 2-oxoglutarate dehydrogenase E1 component [Candidatus Puniceispirillum sp.]|jgi:2-oxoglutarate dehydrogenase E1 component|nr:2-oxoglutarate dehydrogenase E1 component [Candidatus Puniceispirillum sp.]MBL6673405.1 2-oxoglutarate dehydrogenase E1 component [Candidatus Puniceispirillum sp.]
MDDAASTLSDVSAEIDLSLLSGANATFIAEMNRAWRADPKSVDQNWNAYFEAFGDLAYGGDEAESGPSWGRAPSRVIGAVDPDASIKAVAEGHVSGRTMNATDMRAATLDSLRAVMLIRAYRIRGHLIADLDPLSLEDKPLHPELDPKSYGFGDDDWDRPIFIDHVLGLETATLSEIIDRLRKTYCGTIGVEFMHIQDPAQKAWIQERIEAIGNQTDFTVKGKKAIYERLVDAEEFERYLHKKYTGTKRFGMDGAEAVIPALEQILKRGSQLDLREAVIGMAHRGRLNVLHNVLQKPFRAIISEFLGNPANPENAGGSGDVKYHMGASADRDFDDAGVHLSLAPNPSHLEIVDPVVVGRVRAKQQQRGDHDRTQVLGILLHGDAAFAGQGVVAETFAFSALRGYRTGGTIHIIINNQIGFTTSPSFSRSSPYPTDVAKMVMAPIFHVNGDDPEAVVHVARIATEFRQAFGTDAVIDMFCYRRFGHNEGDEPAFTQPLMYNAIGAHLSTRDLYAQRLVDEGIYDQEAAQQVVADRIAYLDAEFEAGTNYLPNKADWLEGSWSGMVTAHGEDRRGETAVELDKLRQIGASMTTPPDGMTLNSKLLRIIKARGDMIAKGSGIDWSTAEHLAFGSILMEGNPVRLSGQDSCRGTFSQRHAVFVDQANEERYTPLNHLSEDQADFEVIDSPLSEASVMGFEYGFSQVEPNALVMWEAQFGDFANGAQVVVDQFISSGEAKWLRMNALVLLLPHGYEGQGPEHSSARLERYLQLCAEDNMQVVNCTTPANYFHALRRQLRRNFRKPLIVMTPKSLLRHKACVSDLADMGPGTTFHRLLDERDTQVRHGKVKRIVLCSGKVYYDLAAARDAAKAWDIEILRVEQLYPFPTKAVKEILSKTPKASVVWCQEEPKNMGGWTFVRDYIEDIMAETGMQQQRLVYAGRDAAASPATGTLSRHNREQNDLVAAALDLPSQSKS